MNINIKVNVRRCLTAAMLLAMLAPAAIAAPQDGKAGADRDAGIAEKWIAAWNSHSPEKMLPVFTTDVFYEDVAFSEVSHGSAELRKFAASEFEGVPDLELKLVRANIHGGHGTIEWIFSGTDKGVFNTGKKFSVRGVSVIDVRDGKISRSLDFYDSGTIMRQVGVLPTPPTDAK
ncbi:MAG: ester cyclase [Candidatus Sulfotelmatobacter sp.]